MRHGFVIALALALPTAASAGRPPIGERIAKRAGRAVGTSAGFAVTWGLRFKAAWRAPLLDAAGQRVTVRVGNYVHPLEKRHQPVVGPRILAKAANMPTDTRWRRLVRAFTTGMGETATLAPPAEGRVEARVAAALRRLAGRSMGSRK